MRLSALWAGVLLEALPAVLAVAGPASAQAPAIKFNTQQIAADMAKLKISKDELAEMFDTIEGITRWPDNKARLYVSVSPDFDPACGKKLEESVTAAIEDLHRRAATRFERVTAADQADAILELSDVPLLDKYWVAASKKPGAAVSYKAPKTTAAVRWDMATVWYTQPRYEMAAGWAYEGLYFSQNRSRPGVAAPCLAFPAEWWIVHISKRHDAPLLNFMLPRNFDFPETQLYDIMNFTIMNAEGVKPGMKGKDLAAALKAALP